jgi:DNA polymerase-3 subunit alpha
VFGNALEASRDALVNDSIVLVRGRIDHKDRDKTCIIVQQIERFEPTREEVLEATAAAAKTAEPPRPLELRVDATLLPATALAELKELLQGFPGDSEVVIELSTSSGPRRVRLGPEFRVSLGAGLHAELGELLGRALLAEQEPPRIAASA